MVPQQLLLPGHSLQQLPLIAALLLGLAACGTSSPPEPSAVTSPSVAPSFAAPSAAAQASDQPALPYGTYSATIPSGVNASPGTWWLTVAEGSVTFTRPDGQSFSPGALEEITAEEIVLAPDLGCTAQQGTPTEGRYRWSREGAALRLEVVSDSCQDRIDTLTISEWLSNQ